MRYWIFIFILILVPIANAIQITEIMYNPVGSDNNKEFVEVYSNTTLPNLSNWTIKDSSSNDSLSLLKYVSSKFALIVEEGFDFSSHNISIYSAGTTIGDDLNNDEDNITLINVNGTIVNSVYYNNSMGGDNNGHSIHFINNSWIESKYIGGTPGDYNNKKINITKKQDIAIVRNMNNIVNKGVKYTSFFKIINNYPEYGKAYNTTIQYWIINTTHNTSFTKEEINSYTTSNTGEYIFEKVGNHTICGEIKNTSIKDINISNDYICFKVFVIDTTKTPCDISINISSENIFDQKAEYYFNINNDSFYYNIEYYITDIFGNIVKDKTNTSNTNKKSFTPNTKDQVYVIQSKLKVFCNDTNLMNNQYNKTIIIKGDEKEKTSSLQIDKIYTGTDDRVKFGEIVFVKLKVYKGNDTKYSIKAYIDGSKKISKETTFNIYDNYEEVELKIPIALYSNCKNKYKDGQYKVIIEGLGKTASESIKVSDNIKSNCQTITKTVTKYKESTTYLVDNTRDKYKLKMPDIINENKTFYTTFELTNKRNETNNFTVYSYAYSGKKVLSGSREENKKEVKLKSYETKKITLSNKIFGYGDMKFKIKIQENKLKTPKEITENIYVRPNMIKQNKSQEILNEIIIDENKTIVKEVKNKSIKPITEDKITGYSIVYESKTMLNSKLVPYIIIIILVSMLIYLIIKKDNLRK